MKTQKNETRYPTIAYKELAGSYFPGCTPENASRNLHRWITRDEDLYNELCRAGWRKRQRLFSPRQIEILFDHLGIPGESGDKIFRP